MRGNLGKPSGLAPATSINHPCDAIKQPSIMDQLSTVEHTLSDTGNLIRTLSAMLEPVSRPSSPTCDDKSCEKVCANGEVVRQLLNTTDVIVYYNYLLQDIINRLEITNN